MQRQADATQGRMLAPLVSYIKAHGQGRVYAGLSSNWGSTFRVGYVPVFKYLLSQGVDEMTYVVPSLSLMLDAEADFDEDNPADYPLFGVRYLILPAGMPAPVPAQEVMARGNYVLWQVPSVGYVSLRPGHGQHHRRPGRHRQHASLSSWTRSASTRTGPCTGRACPPPRSRPAPSPRGPSPPAPGVVDSVQPDLVAGSLRTTVTLDRPGTLLLSVAYDPDWHASVDGRPVQTEMLAPALLGIDLGPGRHEVVFRYQGFVWYPELWALGALGLVGLGMVGHKRR